MARATPHTALEDSGFKLVDQYTSDKGPRTGPVTSLHYVQSRKNVGDSKTAVPIMHHVVLNEFQNNPGKYNVSYHVTQGGRPYAEGDFDSARNHRDNALRGSSDPLREILDHHQIVSRIFDGMAAPTMRSSSGGEVSRMRPTTVGDIGRPMQHLNAIDPVSDEDWNSFVAGRNPILGMMPDGTPLVDHFDHNFGVDEPGARGGQVRRYLPHAAKGPHGEPEIYDPKGECVTCGRPTWNTRDGGQVPEWESTGNAQYADENEMHGPDIPQCANCANEYDTYKEALRAGQRPGGIWHWPGARPGSCPDCDRHVMDEADEDLKP